MPNYIYIRDYDQKERVEAKWLNLKSEINVYTHQTHIV